MPWFIDKDDVKKRLPEGKVPEGYVVAFTWGDADWYKAQNGRTWKTEGVKPLWNDVRGVEEIEGAKLVFGKLKKIPYSQVWLGGTPGMMRMGDMYAANLYLVPKEKTEKFFEELRTYNDGSIEAFGIIEL